jgi:hypothetical protein
MYPGPCLVCLPSRGRARTVEGYLIVHSVSRTLPASFAFAPALRAALVAAGMLMAAPAAQAGTLITNGSFENTTAISNGVGTTINNSDLAGWSTGPCLSNCGSGPNTLFMFLAAPGYVTNGVLFQGVAPVNFYSGPGTSPDGGNAITQDAGNELGALNQTVNGLVAGDHYQLTFYQATMQAIDASVNSSFSASWTVSLGGSTQSSTTMFNPYKGYSPWEQVTMNFTATSASEVLSFLASSPGNGQPPFLLLDGVGLSDIPEPGSLALLVAGAAGLLMMQRRRRLRA